ncbi:hypothetical protein SpCBS45565_g05740 [Spizellomyces sp. 'palustris']|nr:hypothetical protein SpCBS45565_g05740 [Spizellomyces sp. 'palustris']
MPRNSLAHALVTRFGPAMLSFMSLVLVQTTIGLVYKLSQAKGNYRFSQASALALAEFTKFCISTALYRKSLKSRPDAYSLVPNEQTGNGRRQVNGLFQSWINEVPPKMTRSIVMLTLMYGTNNHLTFYLFRLADPGTIQLVKSGSTLVSAGILYLFLARTISSLQWMAIVLQVCGLIVTQYRDGGTVYPISLYAFLLISTCITSVCSCINDHLLKQPVSIHAQNMVLYASGFLLNVTVYCWLAWRPGSTEPGFFEGYDEFNAVMVVFMNSIIGLVITAVYKYADAVIKCLAQSVTTALLIVLSTVLLGVPITLLTAVGSIVLFVSTYLYLGYGPSRNPNAAQNTSCEGSTRPASKSADATKRRPVLGVVIVAFLVLCLLGLAIFGDSFSSTAMVAKANRTVA